jgi:hypothetical protein
MTRPRRPILAAICVVLLLATTGLGAWTWGHNTTARASNATSEADGLRFECVDFTADHGLVEIGRMTIRNFNPDPILHGWEWQFQRLPYARAIWTPRVLGFGFFDRSWMATPTMPRRTTAFVFPMWLPAALASFGLWWSWRGRTAGLGFPLNSRS